MPALSGHFLLRTRIKHGLLVVLLPLSALAAEPSSESSPAPLSNQPIPAESPSATPQPLPTIPLPEHAPAETKGVFSRMFENFYQAPDAYSITNVAGGLSTHRPMYVMPYTYSPSYPGNKTEVVFQISAKQKLFGSNFYFGYTQQSFWQLYNRKDSSPFRETVYNPELFYRWIADVDWLQDWGADGGLEHQSNGKSLPDSRSWNRLYVAPFLVRGKTLYYLKLWYRLPEKEKTSATDAEGDDNPDIARYYGYGELQIQRQLFDNHLAHLMLRTNPTTGKGAVAFNYSIPSSDGSVFYCLNVFSGYGESLIDYNHSVTRIGLGVMMAR